MKTQPRENEQIIKSGAANLQKNVETVGGRLYLTNQRLIFETHAFNFQRGVTEIELSDVVSTRNCWTLFLGFIPIFPNSLAVRVRSGQEYRFVLSNRGGWAKAIEEQQEK